MEIPIGLNVNKSNVSNSGNNMSGIDPSKIFGSGYNNSTLTDIQQQVAEQFGFDSKIQNLTDRIDSERIGLITKRKQIIKDPTLSDEQKLIAWDGLAKYTAQNILFLSSEADKTKKSLETISKNLYEKQQEENKSLEAVANYLLKSEELDFKKTQQNFENNLSVNKYNLDVRKLQLDSAKTEFEQNLKTMEFNKENGITQDFSQAKPGDTFGKWKVSQTYGTSSVLGSDNVKLKNGQIGTPGIDLVGSEGDGIPSFVGGKVIKVITGKKNIPQSEWGKTGGSYGNQVIIEDENGNQHIYNHLSGVGVKVGDQVSIGQPIATMGNTGTSTGTHLDYRVKSSDGQWDDPRQYLNNIVPKAKISEEDTIKRLNMQVQLKNAGYKESEIKQRMGDLYIGDTVKKQVSGGDNKSLKDTLNSNEGPDPRLATTQGRLEILKEKKLKREQYVNELKSNGYTDEEIKKELEKYDGVKSTGNKSIFFKN